MSQVKKKVVHVNKKVFAVKYTNQDYKIKAMKIFNSIPGVSAYNDNKSGCLSRDVTVTTTGSTKLHTLRELLNAYGSVQYEKAFFIVKFKDCRCKNAALVAVKALKGVDHAGIDRDDTVSAYGSTVPSILTVAGEADPRIVLNKLRQFVTAQIA